MNQAVDTPVLEEEAAPAEAALAEASTAAPTGAPPPVSSPPSEAAPGRGPVLASTFADARLKVGHQLQLEPPRLMAGGRATVTLLGWNEGISLIVSAPQNGAGRVVLQEGERVLLRAFTGTSAFAFRAEVLRAAHQPFHYLHLSFPTRIDGVAVRNSPRCRVNLPARIGAGDESPGPGILLNISTTGALIETAQPLRVESGLVRIAVTFELHGVPVSLDLQAEACGAKVESKGGGASGHQLGVEFRNLQPNDRLILGSLVWYQMYEHPRSVA